MQPPQRMDPSHVDYNRIYIPTVPPSVYPPITGHPNLSYYQSYMPGMSASAVAPAPSYHTMMPQQTHPVGIRVHQPQQFIPFNNPPPALYYTGEMPGHVPPQMPQIPAQPSYHVQPTTVAPAASSGYQVAPNEQPTSFPTTSRTNSALPIMRKSGETIHTVKVPDKSKLDPNARQFEPPDSQSPAAPTTTDQTVPSPSPSKPTTTGSEQESADGRQSSTPDTQSPQQSNILLASLLQHRKNKSENQNQNGSANCSVESDTNNKSDSKENTGNEAVETPKQSQPDEPSAKQSSPAPPVSDKPVSDKPVSDKPVSKPPPTTQSPATQSPTTQSPVTSGHLNGPSPLAADLTADDQSSTAPKPVDDVSSPAQMGTSSSTDDVQPSPATLDNSRLPQSSTPTATENCSVQNKADESATQDNGQPANDKAANDQAANGQAANDKAANSQATNGQAANGQAANGQAANGQAANGQAANGQTANGQAVNGQAANSQAANSQAANSQAANSQETNDQTAESSAVDEVSTLGTVRSDSSIHRYSKSELYQLVPNNLAKPAELQVHSCVLHSPRPLPTPRKQMGRPSVIPKATNRDDMLRRRVLSQLNRLTPQNFGTIANEVFAECSHRISSRDELQILVEVLFEKACDEKTNCEMYTTLVVQLHNWMKKKESEKSGDDSRSGFTVSHKDFLREVIQSAQTRFMGLQKPDQLRLQQIDELHKQIANEQDEAKLAELQAELDQKIIMHKIKKKGNVKFIGMLYRLQVLKLVVIRSVYGELHKEIVNNPDSVTTEASVEALRELLFQTASVISERELDRGLDWLREVMNGLKKAKTLPHLPTRLKLLLQDVLDMETNDWKPKQDFEGPKKLVDCELMRGDREILMDTVIANRGSHGGRGYDRSGHHDRRRPGNYRPSSSASGVTGAGLPANQANPAIKRVLNDKPVSGGGSGGGFRPGGGNFRPGGRSFGPAGGNIGGTSNMPPRPGGVLGNAMANNRGVVTALEARKLPSSRSNSRDNSLTRPGRGPTGSDRTPGGRTDSPPLASTAAAGPKVVDASGRPGRPAAPMSGGLTHSATMPSFAGMDPDSQRMETRLSAPDEEQSFASLEESVQSSKLAGWLQEFEKSRSFESAFEQISAMDDDSQQRFFEVFFISAVERKDRARMGEFLYFALWSAPGSDSGSVSVDNFLNGLCQFATSAIEDDIQCDVPRLWEFVGQMLYQLLLVPPAQLPQRLTDLIKTTIPPLSKPIVPIDKLLERMEQAIAVAIGNIESAGSDRHFLVWTPNANPDQLPEPQKEARRYCQKILAGMVRGANDYLTDLEPARIKRCLQASGFLRTNPAIPASYLDVVSEFVGGSSSVPEPVQLAGRLHLDDAAFLQRVHGRLDDASQYEPSVDLGELVRKSSPPESYDQLIRGLIGAIVLSCFNEKSKWDSNRMDGLLKSAQSHLTSNRSVSDEVLQKDEREVLVTVQIAVAFLQHPPGLLNAVLGMLTANMICSRESVLEWSCSSGGDCSTQSWRLFGFQDAVNSVRDFLETIRKQQPPSDRTSND